MEPSGVALRRKDTTVRNQKATKTASDLVEAGYDRYLSTVRACLPYWNVGWAGRTLSLLLLALLVFCSLLGMCLLSLAPAYGRDHRLLTSVNAPQSYQPYRKLVRIVDWVRPVGVCPLSPEVATGGNPHPIPLGTYPTILTLLKFHYMQCRSNISPPQSCPPPPPPPSHAPPCVLSVGPFSPARLDPPVIVAATLRSTSFGVLM